MTYKNRQSGLTIWGLLFTVAVILYFGLLFMKLFPPYYDNLRIHKGMELLVDENDVTKMPRREIIRRLNRILLIDYVDQVVDMKEALRLERRDEGIDLRVKYEVVVPLIYNLSALIEFDNVVFASYDR
ncbi:MAG: DUF4845 domain-containing protein [Proteobacteria bacterium]|nr:MAG: DUF4845 domain-containing protein [Pseudomonadota bacterium]